MIKKTLFLTAISTIPCAHAESPWTQERLVKATPIVMDDLPGNMGGGVSIDARAIKARAVFVVAYSSQYSTDGLSEAGNATLAAHKKELQVIAKKLVDDYWNTCGTAPECVKAWKKAEYWQTRHLAAHAGSNYRPGAPHQAALGDQVAELFDEPAEDKLAEAVQQ